MIQIDRDKYLKQLIDGRENGLVKIITGIRRCEWHRDHQSSRSSFAR